jgi:hypothetical protein
MQCHMLHRIRVQQKIITNSVRSMLIGMFFNVAAVDSKIFLLVACKR